MAKRALLMGSQTGGLTGVHDDVALMAETLTGAGFTARPVTGSAASYAGIVGAYQELIEETQAGDAVVVYYSGHGGREPNVERAPGSREPAWLQYLVPTDIDDRSGGTFRGLLAAELSVLQARLTARTRNVTTILDCCHAARMSRDPKALPKADAGRAFPWASVRERWARIAATADVEAADTNRDAVQLLACQVDQSAYEVPLPAGQGMRGAFTVALTEVLRSSSVIKMSWREILGVVQRRVAGVVAMQTPGVHGPASGGDRLAFSLTEKSSTGVLPIVVQNGVAWLLDAGLLGIAEGDQYAVVVPGGNTHRPRTRATVDRLEGDRARLKLATSRASFLPAGSTAHAMSGNLSRRSVAVVPVGHRDRATVVAAIKGAGAKIGSRRPGALAVVEVSDDGVTVADAAGQPLVEQPTALPDGGAEGAARAVRTLGRAAYLRELTSGEGEDELPPDVDVSVARLDPAAPGGEVALATSGEHLFVDDRFVVRVTNHADDKRYLNVLDIGLRGSIALMTTSEPTGVTLEAGETYVVGENAAHQLTGIRLFWPPGLPQLGPRPESYVVVVADARIEGLPSLAQPGVRARDEGWETKLSGIERLVADAGAARRDGELLDPPVKQTRYGVHRFDLMLHPTARPAATAIVPRSSFALDTAADPSYRLVVPRSAPRTPRRIGIRLDLLRLDGDPRATAAELRLDTLVVTAAAGPDGRPFQARTVRLDRHAGGFVAGDADLFVGPVGRFVDIAAWVSRPGTPADPVPGLDELLTGLANEPAVATALRTLARLAEPNPPPSVVAASEAAVAALVGTAARALADGTEASTGVYRTTLLPSQRYGTGSPGRHPASGTIRAGDAELALLVTERRAT